MGKVFMALIGLSNSAIEYAWRSGRSLSIIILFYFFGGGGA